MGRLPSSMIFLAERPVSDSAGSEAATWCPYSFSIHLRQPSMHQAAISCVSSAQGMVLRGVWRESGSARHALAAEGATAAVKSTQRRRVHPCPRQPQALKDGHGEVLSQLQVSQQGKDSFGGGSPASLRARLGGVLKDHGHVAGRIGVHMHPHAVVRIVHHAHQIPRQPVRREKLRPRANALLERLDCCRAMFSTWLRFMLGLLYMEVCGL